MGDTEDLKPRGEVLGVDIGIEGQKFAAQLVANEEAARAAGRKHDEEKAQDALKADSYLVVSTRIRGGRFRAETIERGPYGMGFMHAFGDTPEAATRALHLVFARALMDTRWSTDWDTCRARACNATFTLTETIK